MLAGIKADFEKVKSPVAFLQFIFNGILTEFVKWFGSKTWIWNCMYGLLGYNSKMTDKSQQPRYHRIKELIEQYAVEKASILDVGCGTCNSLPIWREAGISSYFGIDVAEAAINIARSNYGSEKSLLTKFQAAGIFDFDAAGQKFDVIVFNEVLQVVKSQAMQMVEKALTLLKPQGYIIISMSECHHSDDVWIALGNTPNLGKSFREPVTKGQVRAPEGNAWQVAIYRPELHLDANASTPLRPHAEEVAT